MKKLLACICTILLLTVFTGQLTNASVVFKDISKLDAESKTNITLMYEKQLVKGTTATTFSPNSTLTQSQISIIMGRYFEKNNIGKMPTDWETKTRFTDLPVTTKNKELLKYAAIMKDNGIITTDKLYASSIATRGQMAVVLNNAFQLIVGKNLAQYNEITFLPNDPEVVAITGLIASKITNQTADKFNRTAPLKRVQFVNFFVRWENYVASIKGTQTEDGQSEAGQTENNPTESESKDIIFSVSLEELEVEKIYEVKAPKINNHYKSVQLKGDDVLLTYAGDLNKRSEFNQIIELTAEDKFGRKYNTYRYLLLNPADETVTVMYNSERSKRPIDPNNLTTYITPTTILLDEITSVQNVSFVDSAITEPVELYANIRLDGTCEGICIEHYSNAFSTDMMQFDAVGNVTNKDGQKVQKAVTVKFYFDINGTVIVNLTDHYMSKDYQYLDNEEERRNVYEDLTVTDIYGTIDQSEHYLYFATPNNKAGLVEGFIEGTTVEALQQYFGQSGKKADLWGLNKVTVLVVDANTLSVIDYVYVNRAEGINKLSSYTVDVPKEVADYDDFEGTYSYEYELLTKEKVTIRPLDYESRILEGESRGIFTFMKDGKELGTYRIVKKDNGEFYFKVEDSY